MNEKLLNQTWILSKWSTEVNAMATHEVRITGQVDGPNGHDWVIVEGHGFKPLAMPLEHFLKQAVPMDETNTTEAFLNEILA